MEDPEKDVSAFLRQFDLHCLQECDPGMPEKLCNARSPGRRSSRLIEVLTSITQFYEIEQLRRIRSPGR